MSGQLSGRVTEDPSALVRELVLDPQFRYETRTLLPSYVAIEKVIVAEYLRMDLIDAEQARTLGGLLDDVTPERIEEARQQNLSDIALALERTVTEGLSAPVPVWHVDRSRNDLQACAQVMYAKQRLRETAGQLHALADAARRLAERSVDVLMPGYTHFQSAQVISAGFYFAALDERLLRRSRRLLLTYDSIDACPLGAGALSGQELAWDRERIARLLGFERPEPLALTAVASREWALEATAELGLLGATLSRFCTDLLMWAGSEHGFLDLPDALSGISASMPQKKNFPLLERIRGKTAHLAAFHVDALLGQRNTPYTNLVEVSKEAGAHVAQAFDTGRDVLRLFTAVLEGLRLREDKLLAACEKEFFGGFTLANQLTLRHGIPWRTAQVIAGGYVLAAVRAGHTPEEHAPDVLREIAAGHGHTVDAVDAEALLQDAFDVRRALRRMSSAGSAHPDRVGEVLAAQQQDAKVLADAWAVRADAVRTARATTNRALGLVTSTE
ncbi:argininosuccinate lyase [Streptomyces coeruleofuscus]|uniref:argininosuccinate lyase n=1 Tax=Streptomyces coeruleofuscus TaxID=66879 RepID=A0ABP5V2W4_9ACTN